MSEPSPSERVDKLVQNREDALKIRSGLRDAASAFRDSLRDARSEVLADAEGFMAVVAAVERLGKWLNPRGNGFGTYEHGLRLLVQTTGVAEVPGFARDLCVLRESRNDTAHGGSAARHAADEALRVSMVLEEALTVLHTGWENVTSEHVMTRNPVVAEPWQLVTDVRRVMLTRGFTALPFRATVSEPWRLVTDDVLVAWLHEGMPDGKSARQHRLKLDLASAVAQGLNVVAPSVVAPESTVASVAAEMGLRLVTARGEAAGHLLGVIAPADLL